MVADISKPVTTSIVVMCLTETAEEKKRGGGYRNSLKRSHLFISEQEHADVGPTRQSRADRRPNRQTSENTDKGNY